MRDHLYLEFTKGGDKVIQQEAEPSQLQSQMRAENLWIEANITIFIGRMGTGSRVSQLMVGSFG